MSKAKVLTVANEKGGVGKSTNSITIARALVERGRKCIIIDLDESGGATTSLGVKMAGWYNTLDVITGGVSITEAVLTEDEAELNLPKNLHLLAASPNFQKGIADFLAREENSQMPHSFLLGPAVQQLRDAYDYIIIDTPPLVTSTTAAAFGTSDYVLIPTQLEKLSVERISQAMRRTESARRYGNPKVDVLGIIVSMAPRPLTLLAKHHIEQLDKMYKTEVGEPLRFDHLIHRAVALPESQDKKMTLFDYDPNHPLIETFRGLAREIEERIARRESRGIMTEAQEVANG